jgi:hypothetical protein
VDTPQGRGRADPLMDTSEHPNRHPNRHPNLCPLCPRHPSRRTGEWATDGTGAHRFAFVGGRPVHDECLVALNEFVNTHLGAGATSVAPA